MADQICLLIFCVTIFSNVFALPTYPCTAQKKEHCIEMTPAKEAEIKVLVTKIAKYIDHLATEHENFDISMIKLFVESHSDDEKEDKEVHIHVTVNDCNDKQPNPVKQSTELPTGKYQIKYTTNLPTDSKDQTNDSADSIQSMTDETNAPTSPKELADQTKTANGSEDSKNDSKELAIPENKQVKPAFYKLDLPPNAEELVKVLGKNKQTPLLVYIQEREAAIEYIFP